MKVLSYKGQTLGVIADKLYTVDQLLTDTEIVSYLFNLGITMKYVIVNESMNIDFKGVEIHALDQFFAVEENMRSRGQDPTEQLKEALKAQFNMEYADYVALKEMREVIEDFEIVMKDVKLALEKRLPLESTVFDFVRNHNTKAVSFKAKNEDLVMSVETDKIFFKVPSIQEITAGLFSYPAVKNFHRYYSDKIDLHQYTDMFFKQKYLPDDAVYQRIAGHENMNDLPIQENEKEYYAALCKLINDALIHENPNKDIEAMIEAHMQPRMLKSYFIDYANVALYYHRLPTSRVPLLDAATIDIDDPEIQVESSSDDDDEDTDVKKDLDPGSGFYARAGMSQLEINQAARTLSNIEEYVSKSLDSYAWAEAIVKLLRWGSRKPAKLKLEANKKYLDLQNFEITSHGVSLSELPEVVYDGGFNRLLIGFVVENAEVSKASTRYLSANKLASGMRVFLADNSQALTFGYRNGETEVSIPIGVRLIKSYQLPEGDATIDTQEIVDILSVIEEYEKGNPNFKIAGLEYTDGEFKVSEEYLEHINVASSIDYNMAIDMTAANPPLTIHYSEEITKLLIDAGFKRKISMFDVWHELTKINIAEILSGVNDARAKMQRGQDLDRDEVISLLVEKYYRYPLKATIELSLGIQSIRTLKDYIDAIFKSYTSQYSEKDAQVLTESTQFSEGGSVVKAVVEEEVKVVEVSVAHPVRADDGTVVAYVTPKIDGVHLLYYVEYAKVERVQSADVKLINVLNMLVGNNKGQIKAYKNTAEKVIQKATQGVEIF